MQSCFCEKSRRISADPVISEYRRRYKGGPVKTAHALRTVKMYKVKKVKKQCICL